VGWSLRHLSEVHRDRRFANEAERSCGKLYGDLTYLSVSEVFDQGLHEFLDYMQVRLNQLGNTVSQTFFQNT